MFDITIGREPAGTVKTELRTDKASEPANNVRALCTGEKGFGFAGSVFRRVIPRFMCQGGDYTRGDGTGDKGMYGSKFNDENVDLKHTGAGTL